MSWQQQKKVFSFKAEFQSDIHPFFIAAGKVAIEQKKMIWIKRVAGDVELMESFVEIESTLDLETLKAIADRCENCHRISQTMRQCPMEENSFKTD